MKTLTIAYAQTDEQLALRLANDLQNEGYTFGELSPQTTLVAVLSPEAVSDAELSAVIQQAAHMGSTIVIVKTADDVQAPANAQTVTMQGYDLAVVLGALGQSRLTARQRNIRFGLWTGGSVLLLFLLYTVAIAIFDIEAPIEEFQQLYTRDAATINAFAQEYIPRSTEQAAQFESTLEGINRDLSTVVVATATQAAAEGGFTPLPTGQIIAVTEQSEVRQLATDSAIIRATETAQGNVSQEDIAQTATSAAATANAELAQQQLTVTAAAGG